MRWLSWRTLLAVASLLGTLAAAGAAGYLQLTTGTYPFFKPVTSRRAWAVGVITTVAVVAALGRFIQTISLTRREARGRRVASALRGLNKTMAMFIDDEKKSDRFGASAYVVRGFWPIKWLHRIERERVADLPLPSSITWRPGKGVIGRAVKTGEEQVHDAGAFHGKHRKKTRKQWKAQDADTRMGLSHREFQRIGHKYGTVIAVPMVKGERAIGCVAFDAPPGLHARLVEAEAVEVVAAAAATVADIIN